MRQLFSGLVAAVAVVAASSVPAMACGGGLFGSSCSPCGYVSPCAQAYVAPVASYGYSGCNTGCGGWAHERLPDPVEQYHADPVVHQYYHVNQGPTYTGPGNWAPGPVYREGGYGERPYYYGRRHHYYAPRMSHRYGYAPRHGYMPRFYAPRHSMRYGAPMGMPHRYGHHYPLRRYY